MEAQSLIPSRMHEVFGTAEPVALVTGSVKPRVGRGVARLLRTAGFRIVLHGHHEPETSQQPAPESDAPLGCDLTVYGPVEKEEAVRRWVEQIVGRMGRIDCVVHTAAIWHPIPLEKLTAADYDQMYRINALGTALVNQHFGLRMCQQESGGALINIGDWAICRPYRDFAAYFPSKAAVDSITKTMAVELGQRNPRVRVNAILPGPVKLRDDLPESRRQQILAESLLKRIGTPEDVGWAALYLALSPFVTGASVPVDGGRTIYAGPAADPIAHPDV
ncbi:MAG: SDR family oxidoreductase [Planctomycetota bacterium]|nr:MAG: SDR family oxidoreductase [Planctomycetota bacterium]